MLFIHWRGHRFRIYLFQILRHSLLFQFLFKLVSDTEFISVPLHASFILAP